MEVPAHSCPDLSNSIAMHKLWTLRRCYGAGQVWAWVCWNLHYTPTEGVQQLSQIGLWIKYPQVRLGQGLKTCGPGQVR